jgi:hypothetical protein
MPEFAREVQAIDNKSQTDSFALSLSSQAVVDEQCAQAWFSWQARMYVCTFHHN